MKMESEQINGQSIDDRLLALGLRKTRQHGFFGSSFFGDYEPTRQEWTKHTLNKIAADLTQMLFTTDEAIPVNFNGQKPYHLATPTTGRSAGLSFLHIDKHEPAIDYASITGLIQLDRRVKDRNLPLVRLARFMEPPTHSDLVLTLPDLAHQVQVGDAQILWQPPSQQ